VPYCTSEDFRAVNALPLLLYVISLLHLLHCLPKSRLAPAGAISNNNSACGERHRVISQQPSDLSRTAANIEINHHGLLCFLLCLSKQEKHAGKSNKKQKIQNVKTHQ
jgi:hypothetical protein